MASALCQPDARHLIGGHLCSCAVATARSFQNNHDVRCGATSSARFGFKVGQIIGNLIGDRECTNGTDRSRREVGPVAVTKDQSEWQA
jgi:Na+/glutamate symporter